MLVHKLLWSGCRAHVSCNWLVWNHDCNSMYGHGFCMYAMVCMDRKYFLLYKRNINYNKLHWHGKNK